MSDDQLFRLMVCVEFAMLLPFMAFYRIRSQLTGESLDRRQEGILILVGLRLLGFVCFGGALAMFINPMWLAWSAASLTIWLRWLGIVLIAIAGVFTIWTFHHLGKNLTDTVVTRKVHTLVIAGPYRWVRHPFYVGIAMVVCGVWLALSNWFFLVTGAAVMSLLIIRVAKEEANLIERFGDEYRSYMDRTPRFLPRCQRP